MSRHKDILVVPLSACRDKSSVRGNLPDRVAVTEVKGGDNLMEEYSGFLRSQSERYEIHVR